MTPLRAIAQLKFKLMRVNPYVQMGNTVMLIFLTGWTWWYIPALAGLALAFLFESRQGIRGEMDLTWKNSETWQLYEARFNKLYNKVMG